MMKTAHQPTTPNRTATATDPGPSPAGDTGQAAYTSSPSMLLVEILSIFS